jgi:hypothetical protein
MSESPLAGDENDPFAARAASPPPPGPSYGGLAANPKAKNRRGQVQFFDSADWAMRQGGAGEQPATPEVLASFTQAPSEDAPVAAESEASILFSQSRDDE